MVGIGAREGGSESAAGCRGVVVCWEAWGEVATRAPCRGVQSSTFLSWRWRLPKAAGASCGTANCCTNKGCTQARQNISVPVSRLLGIIDVAVATSDGVTGTTATAPARWMRQSQLEVSMMGLNIMVMLYIAISLYPIVSRDTYPRPRRCLSKIKLPWQAVHLCVSKDGRPRNAKAPIARPESSVQSSSPSYRTKTVRVYECQRGRQRRSTVYMCPKRERKEMPFWYLCLGGPNLVYSERR